jgi:predicted nucleic acid-binding protein
VEAPIFMKNVLDAGPLIAALSRHDEYHAWACEVLARVGPPFYSCPEAMAEAAAMTGKPAAIVEMIKAGEIVLAFDLAEQADSVLALLDKYKDREMDLADACLVRMSELNRDCRLITVDRTDFSVYRRNGRDLIPLLAPPRR